MKKFDFDPSPDSIFFTVEERSVSAHISGYLRSCTVMLCVTLSRVNPSVCVIWANESWGAAYPYKNILYAVQTSGWMGSNKNKQGRVFILFKTNLQCI
jgi:hypothetical protein